jgi:predicted metal-dependent HD superfamily phosphohydrolase
MPLSTGMMTLAGVFGQKLIEEVRRYYEEAHRHYHAWPHPLEMLEVADRLGIRLTLAQCMSILWHDIVYIPGMPKGMNEKASALLMQQHLARGNFPGVTAEVRAEAFDAVLATAEHIPLSEEHEVVLDLDLYRLAVDYPVFGQHADEIRAEYAALLALEADPQLAWERGRGQFYKAYLERPRLFYSAAFQHLETAARDNLKRGLAELRGADAATRKG